MDTFARRFFSFTSKLICVVFLVAGFAVGQGTAHIDWARQRWKAQWIACPETPQRDAGVFHFRKIVEIKIDLRVTVYVSGYFRLRP